MSAELELVRLREEVEMLRASAAAQESHLLTVTQEMDAMLMGVEQQRNDLSVALSHAASIASLLDRINETVEDFVVFAGTEGCIQRVNRQQAERIGFQPSQLVGACLDTLVSDADLRELTAKRPVHFPNMRGVLCDTVCALGRYSGELCLNVPGDAADKVWQLRAAAVYTPQGKLDGVVAIFTDVTHWRKAQTKMRLSAGVFTHAREGIIITDAQGNILDVNNAFTRITGYSHDEVLGRNPRFLQSGQQAPEFYAAMWSTLATLGHWSGEVWNRKQSGEIYAEMLTISAVRNGAGETENYVALFSDITPMKNHQQQLEHIAHYDMLTNLPNRMLLADRLQQAMVQCAREGNSLAVVFLDLDAFKAINDKHGHDAGDQLLMQLSRRMKEALRETDTLARMGGDEFVAVLAGLADGTDCELLLARLLQAASDPVMVSGKSGPVNLQVSASIGVTMYPQDSSDADLLLRHADQAMYAAKQAGKNRYHVFDLANDAAIQTQRESLEHIRYALENDQFVLFFQPKVNMRTGQVIGAEALIRWQHPSLGLLSPAAFLSVIEDDPLIVDLGEWVIDTALRQMSVWQREGMDLRVSVNIGARQLQQEDFALRVQQMLNQHPSVAPHCLQLEVLETSAMQDMAQVGATMAACHASGVSFALDDFGTGYSSLSYLKHLPAECLKIDQSFVRDMLEDPGDLAIVIGVIGLAKAFGRQVIAEGVETSAHRDLLLSVGCELGQGFGIAKPMPAHLLPVWVANWQSMATWLA